MKASVSYNDLMGTSAADINDNIPTIRPLEYLGKMFEIDQERYRIVGMSILGANNFSVSFICVDNQKSTTNHEHIVKILTSNDLKDLSSVFKRFETIMFMKNDYKYSQMDIEEEITQCD